MNFAFEVRKLKRVHGKLTGVARKAMKTGAF
jgi:hypothetical protein